MSQKKNIKRMLTVLIMALLSTISFAQDVNLVNGVEPLPSGEQTPGSEYTLVFHDEFNEPNGTLPNTKVWRYCTRYPKVTWARFLSSSPEVAYMQDGNLVLRAIPNPDKSKDNVEMLSGGIETSQSFMFRFGRVECRALVNPFIGNFPAIWMMPKTTLGWPKGGEIDIFEQIDNEQRAYATVHSTWTQSHGNEPHSGNLWMPMNRYHIYAVEWEEDVLTFFVDGKRVYQYKKQNDSQEQWPFDKSNFYLILNQSVGNGSWAKKADINHTYEMRVDWIRVYQKEKHIPTSISVPMTEIQESTESDDISSLQGAKIGTHESELPKGIYVLNGKKFVK